MVDGVVDDVVDDVTDVVKTIVDIANFAIDQVDFGLGQGIKDMIAGISELPKVVLKHTDFASRIEEEGYGTLMFKESLEYMDNLLTTQKFQLLSMAGNTSFDTSIFDEDFGLPNGMIKATVKEDVMFSANKAVAYHTGMDAMTSQKRAVFVFNTTREGFYTAALDEIKEEYIAIEKQVATLQRMVNY